MSGLPSAGTTPNYGAWLSQGYANQAVPRRPDPATLHSVSGYSMGTSWSLRFGNPAMLPLEPLRACVQAALDQVVEQMSHWEAGSAITRFNQAPAGSWHTLPAEFFEVLQCALHWAEQSGGASDPSVGALVNAWGFGPRQDGANAGDRRSPPSAEVLQEALGQIGWQRLEFDALQRRIRQPGGLLLDLSGIAKGYAADHAARALQAEGVIDFLIEVGGELLGRGQRPDGSPWRVAIAAPDAPAKAAWHLPLQQLAVATSGDAWHAFEHNGRRYSHTLDPRSGEPVSHALASVTVLHASCMQADVLATTLTVLGVEAGLAFADRHGIAALFVERQSGGQLKNITTPGFARLATPARS